MRLDGAGCAGRALVRNRGARAALVGFVSADQGLHQFFRNNADFHARPPIGSSTGNGPKYLSIRIQSL